MGERSGGGSPWENIVNNYLGFAERLLQQVDPVRMLQALPSLQQSPLAFPIVPETAPPGFCQSLAHPGRGVASPPGFGQYSARPGNGPAPPRPMGRGRGYRYHPGNRFQPPVNRRYPPGGDRFRQKHDGRRDRDQSVRSDSPLGDAEHSRLESSHSNSRIRTPSQCGIQSTTTEPDSGSASNLGGLPVTIEAPQLSWSEVVRQSSQVPAKPPGNSPPPGTGPRRKEKSGARKQGCPIPGCSWEGRLLVVHALDEHLPRHYRKRVEQLSKPDGLKILMAVKWLGAKIEILEKSLDQLCQEDSCKKSGLKKCIGYLLKHLMKNAKGHFLLINDMQRNEESRRFEELLGLKWSYLFKTAEVACEKMKDKPETPRRQPDEEDVKVLKAYLKSQIGEMIAPGNYEQE